MSMPKKSDIIPLKEAVSKFRKEYMQKAVLACGLNLSEAAKLLGIDRKTMYNECGGLRKIIDDISKNSIYGKMD